MTSRTTLAAIAIILAAWTGRAADVSATLDIASAYVFRGATFNDGAVAQPGVEIAGLPVTFGVWGNLDIDDYDDSLEDGQFSEIDIYASYTLPVEAVETSLGYCEYTYPMGGGEADREVSLSAGLPLPLAPTIAVYYGVDGGIDKTVYIEAGVSQAATISEGLEAEISAAIGYLDPDEGESGFSHAQASVSLSYSLFSLGVTYIAQVDDDVLPDVEDGGAYDTEVVASVGVARDF